jgi:hypothetical protein
MRILLISILFVLSACGNKVKQTEPDNSCVEVIKEDCVCTLEYNPVCGCNNKTYGNACAAECHGITSYRLGECK